ncbi:IclR family transcriptional regulator [Solicola gregarius]|uniref:Helix-turn-helix domain-containing protein n=1 Tax=Solicola gregarius TaxID=2908642 RepID=A0AA46TF02_9ACTN|nr:helix-turn-helix domain-containing protein [Solicola gregarius]UYM04111.1 helix-turn-helix domain-containing protein [Solicola gregarius]
MAAEISQTLDRGLRLLDAVAVEPAGYSIGDLADRLELNRTVVYRLVATLELHGLVHRDRSGRVTAGLGLIPLGQAVRPVLQARATPVLRALADEVGATAHLTVAEGEEATAIAVVEPRWSDFHVAYRVGARHDVRDAAAGRAILLGRSLTVGTPAGTSYVASAGELQPGARGVAAPVCGVEGLDASIGIVSLHEVDIDEIGPLVVRAAAAIARALE